ncbi:hypothetical protein [Streptomyces sp. NPDC087300]|uniref:hypothetical protein n=1 Tax=Streptomyces sp. NPDC087300 TaxID=3365780 RepID=UPI0037FDD7D9
MWTSPAFSEAHFLARSDSGCNRSVSLRASLTPSGRDLSKVRLGRKLPVGATEVTAEGDSVDKSGAITWATGSRQGGRAEAMSSAVLARPDRAAHRVASTVCGYAGGAATPAVSASDLDQLLPAGVTGPQAAAGIADGGAIMPMVGAAVAVTVAGRPCGCGAATAASAVA